MSENDWVIAALDQYDVWESGLKRLAGDRTESEQESDRQQALTLSLGQVTCEGVHDGAASACPLCGAAL